MMKGDPVRCSGELLTILRLMAAFVGMFCFIFWCPYVMASIQTGLDCRAAKVLGKS